MRWFGRPDRDYREELEAHIAMEARENLERGMSAEKARQAALRTFGGALAVREKLADERPLHFWHDLYRDLGYGMRLLKRNPGLAATVVLILALGIGANTAIFSLVEAVLLRMLPVRDPQSLVVVRALTRAGKPDWFSHTDYEWLRDHNQMFSSLAASAGWSHNIDYGDRKERINFFLVSGNYFSTLGVEPAAGRLLTAEDELQKAAAQMDQEPSNLEIRALPNGARSPAALMGDCRAAIREVDARIRIASFEPLSDAVGRSMTPERLVSWLAAGFGVLALLLTSVGLYGILAYTVAKRTSEFGIRIALGAGRVSIVRMVVREGLVLAGIGLLLGFAAAMSLSHLVGSLLFGVKPHDALTFALAAVVLIVVAACASYGPARRATAIDPMAALRCE